MLNGFAYEIVLWHLLDHPWTAFGFGRSSAQRFSPLHALRGGGLGWPSGVVPAVVPWQERSPAGQPMALDTPAGEELTAADFYEVTPPVTSTCCKRDPPVRMKALFGSLGHLHGCAKSLSRLHARWCGLNQCSRIPDNSL